MKHLLTYTFIVVTIALSSCVTSAPQRSSTTTSSAREMSVEAEALKKTEDMNTLLSLSVSQKDEVMITNTVYLKLLKNLKENQETAKIPAAKDSYLNKLKSILNTEQYNKFKTEMGG